MQLNGYFLYRDDGTQDWQSKSGMCGTIDNSDASVFCIVLFLHLRTH